MAQHTPCQQGTCPGSHGQDEAQSWDTNPGPLTPPFALPLTSHSPSDLGSHCWDKGAALDGFSELQGTDCTGFPGLTEVPQSLTALTHGPHAGLSPQQPGLVL